MKLTKQQALTLTKFIGLNQQDKEINDIQKMLDAYVLETYEEEQIDERKIETNSTKKAKESGEKKAKEKAVITSEKAVITSDENVSVKKLVKIPTFVVKDDYGKDRTFLFVTNDQMFEVVLDANKDDEQIVNCVSHVKRTTKSIDVYDSDLGMWIKFKAKTVPSELSKLLTVNKVFAVIT